MLWLTKLSSRNIYVELVFWFLKKRRMNDDMYYQKQPIKDTITQRDIPYKAPAMLDTHTQAF